MPTVEFHGYDNPREIEIEQVLRGRFADLPFFRDIVFHQRVGGPVLDWQGQPRPFVRVLTRSIHKADALRALIVDLADVELLLIDFYPSPILADSKRSPP